MYSQKHRPRRGSLAILTTLVALLLGASWDKARAQDKKLAERIDTLIQVFSDPDAQGENLFETGRAIKQLVAIGKPAVPQLIDAVLGKHATIAVYSALVLDEIGAQAVEQVRARWPKLTEAKKWKLMRFRGKFDYQASLDFALASLGSKQPDVRRQAIEYAGLHKEAKARATLLKLLNREVPKEHRWVVIESLANVGNEKVADALIALLAKDSWAAKGKGLIHPPGYPPPWWPDGRVHVIEALGKMGARKAAPKLLEVLQEKGPDKAYLGLAIVPLLGEWGYAPSIPVLKRILVEAKDCDRVNVARVLVQLMDRAGMPLLLQALTSADPGERRFACKAFAQYGDRSDVLLLGKCLSDPDADVQSLACQGLERITGVVNREPGQTMHTLADVPHWQKWFEKNRAKYQGGK
jgi:HEAT repeat protein